MGAVISNLDSSKVGFFSTGRPASGERSGKPGSFSVPSLINIEVRSRIVLFTCALIRFLVAVAPLHNTLRHARLGRVGVAAAFKSKQARGKHASNGVRSIMDT
jgi:hypothetical protein